MMKFYTMMHSASPHPNKSWKFEFLKSKMADGRHFENLSCYAFTTI